MLVTMHSPREKFWGALLELNSSGASLRGWQLDSVDDYIRLIRAGERIDTTVVFFPMHRIERIELDTRNGDIASLGERFESKTGLSAAQLFGTPEVHS